MSGICGFFNRNDAPINKQFLDSMLAAAPYRAVDGVQVWTADNLAFAYQALNHLSDERTVAQPYRDDAADTTVVLHGRIDNRAEIAGQLGRKLLSTDTETVLLAYQRWGTQCSDKLCGDFAFVIWDGRARRLFASRDPSACIPFYYHLRDGLFVFGSELSQVLAHSEVPRGINEGMVAEHLSTGITSKTETLYNSILRLAPGCDIEVTSQRSQLNRHWNYLPTQQIVYADEREYQQHFDTLFERAVQARLACQGPVGVSLSGGLDSTCVAAMAQSILQASGRQESLLSFSLADTQNTAYDESASAALVAQQWQFELQRIPYQPLSMPDWLELAAQRSDLPGFPSDLLNSKVCKAARAKGVTTLLTGGGADSAISGSHYCFADLLRAREFSQLSAEFAAQRREGGRAAALVSLTRSLGWPVLTSAARQWAQRRRTFAYRSPFLAPQFVQRVDLEARHHADITSGQITNLASWSSWWQSNRGIAVSGRELMERTYAMHGVMGAHPYLDKRLQEFLFAVPSHIKRRAGHSKQFLVNSQLVPHEVAATRVQGDYSAPVREALCSAPVRDLLGQLQIAKQGWVQQEQVDKALQCVASSKGQETWNKPLPHLYLWMVFSVEAWFRSLERSQVTSSAE